MLVNLCSNLIPWSFFEYIWLMERTRMYSKTLEGVFSMSNYPVYDHLLYYTFIVYICVLIKFMLLTLLLPICSGNGGSSKFGRNFPPNG